MLRDLPGRPQWRLLLLSLVLLGLKAGQFAADLSTMAQAQGALPAMLPVAAALLPRCVDEDAPPPDLPSDGLPAESYDAEDESAETEIPTENSSADADPPPPDAPLPAPLARYDDPLQPHNVKLLAAIRAPQPAPRVHVAVLDGAVRADHPDLPALVWIQPRLRAADGSCGGEDCCPRRLPQRPSSHATAVAGLIAAVRENGRGIAGLAEVGDLVSIAAPVEAADGDLRLAAALYCAIEYRGTDGQPLRVVNMSLGLQASHGSVLHDALAAASRAGLLLVASAGNKGRDITRLPRWPASFNSDTTITVEARRYDGGLARKSNYGAGVDLGAPAPAPDEDTPLCTTALAGSTTDSTACAGDYGEFDRTSAAAAVVSGAAARVWRDPRYAGCGAAQLRRILMAEGRYCRDSGRPGVAPVCMLDLGFLDESRIVEDCRK